MASSTYKVYAISSRFSIIKIGEYFRENADTAKTGTGFFDKDHPKNLCDLIENGQEAAYRKASSVILSQKDNAHTCRETMIGSMNYMHNTLQSVFGYYTYPMKYGVVDYIYEHGGKLLTDDEMQAIVAFMERLNGNIPYPIYANIWNNFMDTGKPSIEKSVMFYFPYSKSTMHVLSFLLYIFREKYIMETLYPLLNGGNFRKNMLIIAEEFIKHREWGDSANPAGNLALFAYTLGKSVNCFYTDADGPVSMVAKFHDISIIRSFVKDTVGVDRINHIAFSDALQGNIQMMLYLLEKGDK